MINKINYLEHTFEYIRSNIRDVTKIQCTRCNKIYKFSQRLNLPLKEKLQMVVKEECERSKDAI